MKTDKESKNAIQGTITLNVSYGFETQLDLLAERLLMKEIYQAIILSRENKGK